MKVSIPIGCEACEKDESYTNHSMRLTKAYKLFNNFKVPKIEYLEISLSNICNLQCKMCNAGLSSSWFITENKLSSTFEKNNKNSEIYIGH